MSKRGIRCPAPCGGYVVDVVRNQIRVTCAICGPAGRFTSTGARKLAKEIAGPLGRFQTTAPRAERLRLAQLLRVAAAGLEAARFAVRLAARSRARRESATTAGCGCVYQRPNRSSSLNAPCPRHDYRTNAARAIVSRRRS